LRKQSGKLTGWLSYAYIRTFREIPAINGGHRFPPPYDKPHNVSVLLNYEFNKHFDAGLNWVYSTAIPVTVPTSGYYYGNVWIPEYSERGGTRNDGTSYHRLDLSVNYKFLIAKRFDSVINFSIYNAYNRHNAFAIYFRGMEDEGQGTEAVKMYLFTLIPSLTFNINF
jgi:outer membrane receptor protein involved in Fe transport